MLNTFITIDIGNCYTRVALYELVDGAYQRFASSSAPTTLGYDDVGTELGVQNAITLMSTPTRRLLDDEGNIRVASPRPDGDDALPDDEMIQGVSIAARQEEKGVDAVFITTSIGTLNSVVIGLMPLFSVQSAQHVLSHTYARLNDTVHLQDGRDTEARYNAILSARPDLIVIAGGTAKGARNNVRDMAQLVRWVMGALPPSQYPAVIYTGNSQMAMELSESFLEFGITLYHQGTSLRDDGSIDPHAGRQAIERAVRDLYRLPIYGMSWASALTGGALTMSHQGSQLMMSYLSQRDRADVAYLDIGAMHLVAHASIDGAVVSKIEPGHGVGFGMDRLAESIGLAVIQAALPYTMRLVDIHDAALNKSVQPMTIPQTTEATLFESIVATLGARNLLQAMHPDAMGRAYSQIVLNGAMLLETGVATRPMVLAADIFEPHGVTRIVADTSALMAALGPLAQRDAEAAVRLLDGGNVIQLGTLISLGGRVRDGQTAATVTVAYSEVDVETFSIAGGDLLTIPISMGATPRVSIACEGGVSIGGQNRLTLQVDGTTDTILLDGRGRPLPAHETVQARAEQSLRTYRQSMQMEPTTVPEYWLEPVVEPDAPADSAGVAQPVADGDEDPFESLLPDEKPASRQSDDDDGFDFDALLG